MNWLIDWVFPELSSSLGTKPWNDFADGLSTGTVYWLIVVVAAELLAFWLCGRLFRVNRSKDVFGLRWPWWLCWLAGMVAVIAIQSAILRGIVLPFRGILLWIGAIVALYTLIVWVATVALPFPRKLQYAVPLKYAIVKRLSN